MTVQTTKDMDRRLMMKIVGCDGEKEVYRVSKEMAEQRHYWRMLMLTRWTFLRYCERHGVGELSLEGFGHGLERADIGMWMDQPYMKIYKTDGEAVILAQYSVSTMKELYHYIKGLN